MLDQAEDRVGGAAMSARGTGLSIGRLPLSVASQLLRCATQPRSTGEATGPANGDLRWLGIWLSWLFFSLVSVCGRGAEFTGS